MAALIEQFRDMETADWECVHNIFYGLVKQTDELNSFYATMPEQEVPLITTDVDEAVVAIASCPTQPPCLALPRRRPALLCPVPL
jgi:hypothetical protein